MWELGKPAESELLRRLRLPADDEEHMPPAEEPQLTKEELALLERWVAAGASPTKTLAELNLPPELAATAVTLGERLRALVQSGAAAEAVPEADPAEVARTRAALAPAVAELQRRFPGALTYESRSSAALHFTAAGLGLAFGDAELASLAAVQEAMAVLDLSGTSVTDAAAATLAKFTRLRVLRLAFTRVGDGTLTALAPLARLEVLVLHTSAVTPAGVAAAKALGSLRKLHAGDGAVAAAARELGLPAVDSGGAGLELPEPVPEKPEKPAAK
jgi:hypothetical protein